MTARRIGQLGRTVSQLRPHQVAARVRLRGQRALLRQMPGTARVLLRPPGASTACGWPAGYLPLDSRAVASWPRLAELAAGRIRLLGVERELGQPVYWLRPGDPQLWRYHVHYWDWAWGLAMEPDRRAARQLFADLWKSWHRAVPIGRSDAWHPYPASLRAWSWCGQFADVVRGSDIEEDFVADLARHAGFVRRFLELDVGGNHLLKNLKAAIGLALFFGDERQLGRSLRKLIDQVSVQVLPDGGHFERAPAYHCQVLADLSDVAELLRAAGRTPPPELDLAISRMHSWLDVVVLPGGALPLLNDGFPVEPSLLAALRGGALQGPRPAARLRVLAETGLIRASAGDWELLADVGLPCPPELPAHAHADTLSCVVDVGGAPLLVDTGTSGYAAGSARDYERSTAAHNTVEIDGANSTEVWGAFRAGRRARVYGMEANATPSEVVVTASHDGYRALPGSPRHHRRWTLSEAGLQVEDEVTGDGRHVVVVRWHLAPGAGVRLTESGADIRVAGGLVSVAIVSTAPVSVGSETSRVATGFGQTAPAQTLTCRIDAQLPVVIRTSWSSRALRTLAAPRAGTATELVFAEEAR